MITNNLGNYSLSRLSKTKLNLNDNISFNSRFGCNGFIRHARDKYLYIVIPKKEVDEVLKTIQTLTGISYTFDDILDVFKEMSFEYRYALIKKTPIEKKVVFFNQHYSEYYVIEIEKKKNGLHDHRYYAFCTIRNFYYNQVLLIQYMTLYRFLKTDLEKILMLAAASTSTTCHSFINKTVPIDSNLTFKSLLEIYKYYGNNIIGEGIVYKTPYYVGLTCNVEEVLNEIHKDVDIIKQIESSSSMTIDYSSNTYKLNSIRDLNLKINDVKKYIGFNYSNTVRATDNFVIKGIICSRKTGRPPILTKPIILNSKQKTTSIANYTLLSSIKSKYAVNLDKPSKIALADTVINAYDVILKLKNRKYINELCDQVESSTYPLLLKNKIKRLVEDHKVISSAQDLESYDLKKYVKEPIFKNYKTHYLYFTKDGLFLHQIQLKNRVIDDGMVDFNQYSQSSKEVIKKCTKVFKLSQLDIGVIICNVCDDTNEIYVTDISTYSFTGDFSKITYLKKLNTICVD